MPTGKNFITCDKQYIHKIIVIILNNEGDNFEKPFVEFAKIFEVVPKITAKNKYKYPIK